MSVAKSENTGLVDRVKRYFRNMVQEMKKVHWPSKNNIALYTAVVVATCIAVAAMIWVMDLAIGGLLNLIIK
jgi:preprotein translocase subunit SecE